jgi:hypothetical protein
MQRGADITPWFKVNEEVSMRLLHVACQTQSEEMVSFLLSKEKDPKAAVKELVQGTQSSVMHQAAQGGNPKIIALLEKHGADLCPVNLVKDTPLHISIRHRHVDFSLALISRMIA